MNLKMMKKVVLLRMVIIIALFVTSCGEEESAQTEHKRMRRDHNEVVLTEVVLTEQTI